MLFNSYFQRETPKLTIMSYNRGHSAVTVKMEDYKETNLSHHLQIPSPYLGVSRTGVQLQRQDMLL